MHLYEMSILSMVLQTQDNKMTLLWKLVRYTLSACLNNFTGHLEVLLCCYHRSPICTCMDLQINFNVNETSIFIGVAAVVWTMLPNLPTYNRYVQDNSWGNKTVQSWNKTMQIHLKYTWNPVPRNRTHHSKNKFVSADKLAEN